MVSTPADARSQADYSGPEVVPPTAAYVTGHGHSDTSIPRWRTGGDHERTLWVSFADPPPNRPDFWDAVVQSLATWNEVSGIPVVFRVSRSGVADVEFRWIRRFEARQAGTTDWQTDSEGWLQSAIVTLAIEHEGGRPTGDEFVRMVALHELGHVIGLPHSDDPSDVMHPGNRNLDLSDRDVRSARQLYERLDTDRVSAP